MSVAAAAAAAAAAGPAAASAAGAEERPRWTAILLVSSLAADWDVRSGQRDALGELLTRQIHVEEVDGALQSNRERRCVRKRNGPSRGSRWNK
jgi:hypothetical protein